MPRDARLLLSQSYYHIMIRGNNKNVIFRQKEDYLYYLELIGRFKKESPFDLFHYCLMPTHIHKLIRTKKAKDFSSFMKKIELAYFHYFRKKYGWVGHFWQGRFKSQAVGKDEYFVQCGKYIELNPVRKKIVSDPKEYKSSSYRFYVVGKADPLITPDPFYIDFVGDKKKWYKDLVIGEIVKESYSRKVWGSKSQRDNEGRKIHYSLRK